MVFFVRRSILTVNFFFPQNFISVFKTDTNRRHFKVTLLDIFKKNIVSYLFWLTAKLLMAAVDHDRKLTIPVSTLSLKRNFVHTQKLYSCSHARVFLPVRRRFLHILLNCVHISLMSLASFHSIRVKDGWGDKKKLFKERGHAEICLKSNDIAFPLKHHVKLFLMHSWSSFLYSCWHKPLSSWLFWYIHWYSHCYAVICHSFSHTDRQPAHGWQRQNSV